MGGTGKRNWAGSGRFAIRIVGLGCLLTALSGFDDFIAAAASRNDPPSGLSREASEAAAEKLHRVREGSLSGTTSRQVRITEAEANSYLHYQIAPQFPAGLSNVRLKFQPDRLQGSAEVDFDQLGKSLRRPPNPFLDFLFQGVRMLEVAGDFYSSEGMGQFHLETVSLDGVILPPVVVDFLIESYLKARFPNVAIDQPFPLPYSLEKVTVEGESCLLIGKPESI
ncbi:MAG: hypothetical protein HY649_08205 [Acidobacteria bacterium]|nr:hypothetical protein [Acidobacteriota bacterium]